MASTPDRGDVVWINLDAQAGYEQAGRWTALIISSTLYNGIGLALLCPIINKAKAYPFEVAISPGFKITGVILSEHIKNLDWRVVTLILVILGIVIVAIAVAFDEAPLRRKAIGCTLGGMALGTFFLTPFGVLAGIIAPGSANPIWKDMLQAGLLCGVAGGVIGTLSGAMTLGLSVLFRYIFSDKIKKKQLF